MMTARTRVAALTIAALGFGACGGSDAATTASDTASDASPTTAAGSAVLRVVSPADAAATIADAPDDLVILDVRTPEEFSEGHIDGAVMLDFYRDDFADELAKLDPDVPYVLYCRSGNRSGQALAMMDALGFTEVDDVEGGVINWQTSGLPLVTE
jgi:phage shock protein E